jgi:fibronectin type 3 domain-containing protein
LEAAGLPPSGNAPLRVELSWDINPEPDTAGYNVYRKRSGETQMQRLNRALLPTPVYRDTAIEAGQKYIYQVTAVSQAGVESPASSEAAATGPGAAAPKQ